MGNGAGSENSYLKQIETDIKGRLPDYLRRMGREANRHKKFRCPASGRHKNNDDDFSAHYDYRDGIYLWNCPVCGAAGTTYDAASLLEGHLLESYHFTETTLALADKLGIPIDEEKLMETKKQLAVERAAENVSAVVGDYLFNAGRGTELLQTGKFGRVYTHEQAFNIANIVRVGCVSSEKLTAYLRDNGHDPSVLPYYDTDKGLVDPNVFNEDRLVIPIHSVNGKVVGFTGRIRVDSSDGRKYCNTKGFEKKKHLFLLNVARDQIKKKGRVILVEGQFDAITAHLYGYGETVAVMGSEFTMDKAATLAQYGAQTFVTAFDNDLAGIRATKKVLETTRDLNVHVRSVELPKDEDPDSALRKGMVEVFNNTVEATGYIVSYDPEIGNERVPHDVRYTNAVEFIAEYTNITPIARTCAENLSRRLSESVNDIMQDIENARRSRETRGDESKRLWGKIEMARMKPLSEKIHMISDALAGYRELDARVNTGTANYTMKLFNSLVNGDVSMPKVIKTGYRMLDKYSTLEEGCLAIVSGPPSHGKSSWLRRLSSQIINRDPNAFVFYISTDDPEVKTLTTYVSMFTGVDKEIVEKHLRNNAFSQHSTLVNYLPDLNHLLTHQIEIMGINKCPNMASIVSHARVLRERHKDKTMTIIIDAMNNLSEAMRNEQRVGYESIVRDSKALAAELSATTLLVAHLTKMDGLRRPLLKDLKGTSFLEYEAKIIYLVYMASRYNQNSLLTWRRGDGEILPVVEIAVAKDKEKKSNQRIYYEFDPNVNSFLEPDEMGQKKYIEAAKIQKEDDDDVSSAIGG